MIAAFIIVTVLSVAIFIAWSIRSRRQNEARLITHRAWLVASECSFLELALPLNGRAFAKRLTDIVLSNKLYVGFDDDDPNKHQFAHICHEYPAKALCESTRLWFHAARLLPSDLPRIDCPECLTRLQSLSPAPDAVTAGAQAADAISSEAAESADAAFARRERLLDQGGKP